MFRSELLASAPGTVAWVEVSLIIFIVAFGLVVAWTVFTRTSRWKADARIPLDEDPIETRHAAREDASS